MMAAYLFRLSAKFGTKTILQSCGTCGRTLQTIMARKRSSEVSKVTVNGVQLHCDQTGKGNHPVLLIPGAVGSGASDLGPQFKGLDKDKYKLVTFDPRGYGKSRPPERDFPLDFYRRDAKDAADLMAVLGHDRYSVLGWSYGGIVGIIMAAMYPDHVQKLLVWGSIAYLHKKDINAYEATRDVSSWSEKTRAPMEEMYGAELFQKFWSAWIDGVLNIMVENRMDLCMSDCRKITCPTLIIHGEKDTMVPIEHPHYLNQNIRGSRVLMMAEGKHNLHVCFAEEFNKHAETFLDSSNTS